MRRIIILFLLLLCACINSYSQSGVGNPDSPFHKDSLSTGSFRRDLERLLKVKIYKIKGDFMSVRSSGDSLFNSTIALTGYQLFISQQNGEYKMEIYENPKRVNTEENFNNNFTRWYNTLKYGEDDWTADSSETDEDLKAMLGTKYRKIKRITNDDNTKSIFLFLNTKNECRITIELN